MYSLRFRRGRYSLRRRSYFAVARFRRYARRRFLVSRSRRKFGWTTVRHNKGRRYLRRYSLARRSLGAEIKYFGLSGQTFTWSSDRRWAYSSFLPIIPPSVTDLGHSIRVVYGAVHMTMSHNAPVRVFIVHVRNWSTTEAELFNPFLAFDSPLSLPSPGTDPPYTPIAFDGFYNTSTSGNIRVAFDKVYRAPATAGTQPINYLRYNFARGFDVSFIDGNSAYGRNRWVFCLLFSLPPSNTSATFSWRFGYTNVGE